MTEQKCPYFDGVEETAGKYKVKCGEDNLCFIGMDLYRAQSKKCVGGEQAGCRPFLYRQLKEVDAELPQSDMDMDELRALYEKHVVMAWANESAKTPVEQEASAPPAAPPPDVAPPAERRMEAMELHQYIQAQGRVMAGAMSEIGRSLKRMRDEKLYIALGHESFEGYTVQMLDLKQRQAYNYIKVFETYGPRFLDEHGELGVSKLLLLANVPAPEREDFLAEHDVVDMTTRQLEELTERFNKQAEQLSLLQEEKKETTATAQELTHTLEAERARYRETEQKYRAQLAEMENRPVEVAVQEPDAAVLERIRQEERERAEQKLAEETERARREAFEQFKEQQHAAKEKAQRELEKAEAKAKQELEQAERRAQEAETRAAAAQQEREAAAQNDEALAAAREQARALEQKLRVAENPVSLRINFCFEQIQSQLAQIAACLAEADADAAPKYRAAAKGLLTQLAQGL